MITANEIQRLLDRGNKIWSAAAGRIGEVIGTDDHWVKVKIRRTVCVTHFDRGDPVMILKQGDRLVIHNVEAVRGITKRRRRP